MADLDAGPPQVVDCDDRTAAIVARYMAVGAAHLDAACKVEWANAALATRAGVDLDELVGAELLDKLDVLGLDSAALFGGAPGVAVEREALVLRKGGEPFVARLTATKCSVSHGFTLTLTDLTEIKLKDAELLDAREAAAAADRAKLAFMSVVSHELKTPLNGILGALALLGGSETGRQPLVEALRASSLRMLRTVDNVIEFALLDDAPAARAPVATGRLADLLRAAHGDALAAAGLAFSVRDDAQGAVLVAEHELMAATARLVDNAAKVSPKGGCVRVAISRGWGGEAGRLAVTVEDDGHGFPADGAEALFEGFSQADGTTTRPHEGLGLGLALVKASVRRQSGRIAIGRSESGGASVSLVIERAFDDAAQAPSAAAAPRDGLRAAG